MIRWSDVGEVVLSGSKRVILSDFAEIATSILKQRPDIEAKELEEIIDDALFAVWEDSLCERYGIDPDKFGDLLDEIENGWS